MKKIIYLLTFLCTINNFTLAQSYRDINFECGGFVTEIYVAKNDNLIGYQILYARTDVGGLYRSSNNGNSWINISNYLRQGANAQAQSELCIQGVAIHPSIPDIVFAAWGNSYGEANLSNGIYKTTDGGSSWRQIPTDNWCYFRGNDFDLKLGGECLIYDPTDLTNSTLYLGGGDIRERMLPSAPIRIYKSTDGGETFSGLTSSSNIYGHITSIAMNTTQSNLIYVGTTLGLFKSSNYGNDWIQINPSN